MNVILVAYYPFCQVLPPSKRAARGEKTVTAKVPAGKSKTVAVKHPPPTRNVVSTRKQSSTVAASGSKAKTQTLKGNEKRPMAGKSSVCVWGTAMLCVYTLSTDKQQEVAKL